MATGVASLLAVGVGVYGAVTYQSARDWEERAGVMQDQRDNLAEEKSAVEGELADTEAELVDTETQLNDTQAQLEETEAELGDTEAELVETEDRLADVTAGREAARDTAARLADDLDVAAVVGADLSVCVDDLFGWLGSQPSYSSGGVAWELYFERGFEIADVCGQAQGNFNTFLQALQTR